MMQIINHKDTKAQSLALLCGRPKKVIRRLHRSICVICGWLYSPAKRFLFEVLGHLDFEI